VFPLSIPSPPSDWRYFDLGAWLASFLPFVPEDFSLRIHAYAILILIGIFAAVVLTNHRLTQRGGEPWIIIDISLWAVVFGIVFARLYHVVTHPGDYFGEGKDPWEIVQIWDGGNAIFGALIGGAIGIAIACRLTGLRFWSVADALAPGLLLAQAIGRLGNYMNQELFGLPTDLPWGLEIDRPNSAIPVGIPDDALFHPTFLYELLWNVAGVAVILLIENRVRFVAGQKLPEFERRADWQWGKVLGLYLIWYGIGRTWFESIRLDPSETFLGVRSNVWAALAGIVIGLFIILYQSRNHRGVEPSVYAPGREWSPSTAIDSEDTYSEADDIDGAPGDVDEAPATSGSSRRS